MDESYPFTGSLTYLLPLMASPGLRCLLPPTATYYETNNQDEIIPVCFKLAEYVVFAESLIRLLNTEGKSHLSARRSKLENPFTSLLPVSEWPQLLKESVEHGSQT